METRAEVPIPDSIVILMWGDFAKIKEYSHKGGGIPARLASVLVLWSVQ